MRQPLMEAYRKIKERMNNKIVLIRIGDFFEAFGEDAKTVSKVCGVLLTHREIDGSQKPMAGFPFFSAETYIAKLIEAGHAVALVEPTGEVENDTD